MTQERSHSVQVERGGERLSPGKVTQVRLLAAAVSAGLQGSRGEATYCRAQCQENKKGFPLRSGKPGREAQELPRPLKPKPDQKRLTGPRVSRRQAVLMSSSRTL